MLKLFSNFKFQTFSKLNQTFVKTFKMSKSLVDILIVFDDSQQQSIELSSKRNDYLFDSIKTSIKQLFGPNKYTIYSLDVKELQSNICWHLTTALVISISNQSINRFLNPNNNDLNFKRIHFNVNDLLIKSNQNVYDFDRQLFESKISSYLTTNSENKPKESNSCQTNASKVYLLTKDKSNSFVNKYENILKPKIRLTDENDKQLDKREDSDQTIEVIISGKSSDIPFDSNVYFSNLKTQCLGQWMVFTDITDTTMKLIEPFHGINGFIAIANQQTSGRGRTQNEWLSPKGCAMFTLQLSIKLNSNIGRKTALIQHMAGLSIVRAINTIPGYEGLELGLKWPNDILWTKNRSKLCGILVTSNFCKQNFNILIGCGINVSNREPTVCLNDVIDDYNIHSDNKLDYIKCEEVIARTVTQMELLLKLTEQNDGIKDIQDLYTKHWIHSEEVIKLKDNQSEMVVQIEGLDSEGYLLVKDLSDGSSLSLHPDGNRFDIMQNLIIPRKQC